MSCSLRIRREKDGRSSSPSLTAAHHPKVPQGIDAKRRFAMENGQLGGQLPGRVAGWTMFAYSALKPMTTINARNK